MFARQVFSRWIKNSPLFRLYQKLLIPLSVLAMLFSFTGDVSLKGTQQILYM